MSAAHYEKKNPLERCFSEITEQLRIFCINLLHFHLLFAKNKRDCKLNIPPAKVLLINTGDLGDNVLTFDFIQTLLQADNSKIYVVAKHQYGDLYKLLENITLIPWDKRRYKWNALYRIIFIKKLRSYLFDTVLNITPERGVLNEELTLFAGSKLLVRVNKPDSYICSFYKRILNNKYSITYYPQVRNEYEIIKELALKKELWPSFRSSKYRRLAHKKLHISLAPLSSDLKRNWGINNYKTICHELAAKCNIYILGSESIKEFDGEVRNIYNLSGRTSLADILKILRSTDLFIGNDSGLSHLALYLNIPLIAIIGGGMFNRFFPYKGSDYTYYLYHQMDCFGCSWRCPYIKRYCITKVNTQQVLDKASYVLTKLNGIKTT